MQEGENARLPLLDPSLSGRLCFRMLCMLDVVAVKESQEGLLASEEGFRLNVHNEESLILRSDCLSLTLKLIVPAFF